MRELRINLLTKGTDDVTCIYCGQRPEESPCIEIELIEEDEKDAVVFCGGEYKSVCDILRRNKRGDLLEKSHMIGFVSSDKGTGVNGECCVCMEEVTSDNDVFLLGITHLVHSGCGEVLAEEIEGLAERNSNILISHLI